MAVICPRISPLSALRRRVEQPAGRIEIGAESSLGKRRAEATLVFADISGGA
jgi:hypothetical protein